jgi:Uma2 family endonuclease
MTPVPTQPVPFTYEDYRRLPEDGRRYELIEGDFFLVPSPNTVHQTVSRRLQFALMEQLEHPGHALVFDAPMDVVLDSTNVVQPDLIVVAARNKHLVTQRAIEGAPDVLVEILSPSSMDRDTYIKRKLYERFRIPEYWVVDPEHGFIQLWRHHEGRYGQRARLDRSGTLTSPDFPSLHVPMAPLFRPL